MIPGKRKTGTFLGLPYDWRKPTPGRLKRGVWDPQERRVFVPKAYGWGYGVNLHAVVRLVRSALRGGLRGG